MHITPTFLIEIFIEPKKSNFQNFQKCDIRQIQQYLMTSDKIVKSHWIKLIKLLRGNLFHFVRCHVVFIMAYVLFFCSIWFFMHSNNNCHTMTVYGIFKAGCSVWVCFFFIFLKKKRKEKRISAYERFIKRCVLNLISRFTTFFLLKNREAHLPSADLPRFLASMFHISIQIII